MTTADVARLHRRMRETPGMANRLLALVSVFFTYAARQGVRPHHDHPAALVERYPEHEVERFLTVGDSKTGKSVRSLLGHANVKTTERYAHLGDDPVKGAADRTAGAIEAWMRGEETPVTPLRREKAEGAYEVSVEAPQLSGQRALPCNGSDYRA